MTKAITLACILFALLHTPNVAAQCTKTASYSQKLIPACDPKDVSIKWPNYVDPTTYYKCEGVGNPVLVGCPANQYFTYVLQMCETCANYIPPVECQYLKTQNTPNCVASGTVVTPSPGDPTASTPSVPTGPSMPTPNYPDTPTTQAPTTKAPTTTASPSDTTAAVTTAPVTTGEPGVPTPPTDGESTIMPGPPSPVTNNPDIPTPQTAAPTPPSVPGTPPTIQ